MSCDTCPFAMTDAAEQAQNYGCLPTPQEIMRIKRDTGKNWSCHHDETRICAGFVAQAKEAVIDYRTGPLASYQRWYETGKP